MVEKATLVKFGKHEHLCQLRDEGLLYMNDLTYFWRIEDQQLRGDPFDSVDEVKRGCNGTVTFADNPQKAWEITSWELRVPPPHPEKINIFCMCAVRPSAGSFPVHERNFGFGDFALLLTKPQEFIDMISSGLKSQGVRGGYGLVEYVDKDYKGDVGPFRKLRHFAYQSEWRVVCYDGPGGARKLYIGSIADICAIVPSTKVNETTSELLTC